MHMIRPATQKTIAPPSCRTKTTVPIKISATSAMMMTFLGPILSSSRPKAMVDNPATMLAAAPKTTTSPLLKPNVPAAITAPNAKTPANPSRKSAEAARK